MKILRIAMAGAVLASFGLAAAGQAHPRPHPRPHHRVCKVIYVHHHKVTRCR